MRAVSNAGPIIHLSWIDHLHLQPQLLEEILLPVAVRDEVLRAAPDVPGVVQAERDQLEFEGRDPFAVRWFPKGRQVPVVIDPRIAAGRPTLYHHGVTIDTLCRRWRAGEPIRLIAQDYELRPEVVEEALQYAA